MKSGFCVLIWFLISAILCAAMCEVPIMVTVINRIEPRKVSEAYDLRVFTDAGDYFGDIEDCIVAGNKISGWKIRATKNSFLSKVLGSAKGVIVPHQLVKSVGD